MSQPGPAAEPIVILLVEDDSADEFLTREALSSYRILNVVHSVKDGVQAMAFLRREPPFETATRPDLVLLDLNLPRMSGHEVLAEVKRDPSLKTIPIVILSTSSATTDVAAAYDAHANLYVTKPLDLAEFLSAVQEVEDFFVTIVRLPDRT